jgi:hypothetical protein
MEFGFTAAFLIKSTLGFIILLLLAVGAVATRKLSRWREILFLIVHPAFHLAVDEFGIEYRSPPHPTVKRAAGGA